MVEPIYAIFGLVSYWFFLGIIGAIVLHRRKTYLREFFLLGSMGSVFLLIISSVSLNASPSDCVLFMGIPGYPFHLHWDPLTGFFLILLSVASFGISIFSSDYLGHLAPRTQGMICFNYYLFLISMTWVLLAADAYSFLIAWELMAMSCYFLIVAFKTTQETQHAGFLYFLIAHIGALAILLSFGLMLQGQADFSFDAMRHAQLSPFSATIVFLLALVGFGAKAGLLPFHVWLPEAHPAAPSPISALMSGRRCRPLSTNGRREFRPRPDGNQSRARNEHRQRGLRRRTQPATLNRRNPCQPQQSPEPAERYAANCRTCASISAPNMACAIERS